MSERDIEYGAEPEEVLLGRRLREAREFLGFSQEAVAASIELPRATISDIENGKRKVTGIELSRFASLYRRSVDFFLKGDSAEEDQLVAALFRATKDLTAGDKQQVLKFAEFLKHSGAAPRVDDGGS